jgi:hypothetical protein
MKIAFIGDSFSAYNQYGQEKNHWSYLLAEHFPKHQYINYSAGGRGYDYYRVAMLDAKMKDVDVVLTNETFNTRLLSHIGNNNDLFSKKLVVSDNYKTFVYNNIYWYSIHLDKIMYFGDNSKKVPEYLEKSILETFRSISTSENLYTYNKKWWNNIDRLYNFKHIIKLNLLADPNQCNDENNTAYAYIELMRAYGIHQVLQKARSTDPTLDIDKQKNKLLLDNDLIVSAEDDHWSPKANKWVFDNYILPKVIDILS